VGLPSPSETSSTLSFPRKRESLTPVVAIKKLAVVTGSPGEAGR
jgi:hypothetical protein